MAEEKELVELRRRKPVLDQKNCFGHHAYMDDDFACRHCDRPVERFREHYETFEGMHGVCFHYEFEQRGMP